MVNPLVLIGLGLYLALMLGIGLYASRRVKGSVDYIVAGKRLPLLLCTATLAATWFGGGICIGAASAAYARGVMSFSHSSEHAIITTRPAGRPFRASAQLFAAASPPVCVS